MDLEAFEFVILRSTPDRPAVDEQTAERLQQAHLAFWDSMRQAGHVVASGPFRDQADERMRGLVISRTGSIAQAQRMSLADPLIQAGHLEADVMTWLCKPGTLSLPGRPVRIPD